MIPNWRNAAACADPDTYVDPTWFHPEADSITERHNIETKAKQVCATCPVTAECLTFAIVTRSEGIAGGTNPDERLALTRREQRLTHQYNNCDCGARKRVGSQRCQTCTSAYRRQKASIR